MSVVKTMNSILSLRFNSDIFFLLICAVCAKSVDYDEIECPTVVDPAVFFSGNKVPRGSDDRAKQTLPKQFYLANSTIPFAGIGVFASTFVRKYTWLAEYEGDVIAPEDDDFECDENRGSNCGEYAWTIENSDGSHYGVDGFDERTSNWLRYINCARHMLEENVDSTQCYGRRYYLTVRDIAPGQELLVFYGDEYASELGINVDQYSNREFWTQNYRVNTQPLPQKRVCTVAISSKNRYL